jgi:DNA-binding NarL/FixJ family response regulator
MPNKIRVGLIESNRLLREHIIGNVKSRSDMMIVALTITLSRDIPLPHSLDVVLVDYHDSIFFVVDEIRKSGQTMRIVAINVDPDTLDVVSCVQFGITGFVLKDSAFGDLVTTVRTVVRGDYVVPPSVLTRLFAQLRESVGSSRPAFNIDRITNRQREIMQLVVEGLSNKQIGDRLNIAVHTVKSHVHTIMEKLNFQSRVDLVNYVWKNAAVRIEGLAGFPMSQNRPRSGNGDEGNPDVGSAGRKTGALVEIKR